MLSDASWFQILTPVSRLRRYDLSGCLQHDDRTAALGPADTRAVSWTLTLRQRVVVNLWNCRAVDNQFYVVMCSPARPAEGYQAWGYSGVTDPM